MTFDLLVLGQGFSAFLRASPYFSHSSGRIKGIESHEKIIERFVASRCWGWEESDSVRHELSERICDVFDRHPSVHVDVAGCS
jgi:hypothetical protein